MQFKHLIWWWRMLSISANNLICLSASKIGNNMGDVSFSCGWFFDILVLLDQYYEKLPRKISKVGSQIKKSRLTLSNALLMFTHKMRSSSFEFCLFVKESEIVKSFTLHHRSQKINLRVHLIRNYALFRTKSKLKNRTTSCSVTKVNWKKDFHFRCLLFL